MRSNLSVRATLVANEFIDRYMPDANGEYVKVYLYLLRHQERNVTEVELADVLNHTESDIRRAMTYWEKMGVLVNVRDEKAAAMEGSGREPEARETTGRKPEAHEAAGREPEARETAGREPTARETAGREPEARETTGRKPAVREAAGHEPEARETGAHETAADETAVCETAVCETAGCEPTARKASDGRETSGKREADSLPEEAGDSRSSIADTRIPAQRPLYTPEQVRSLGDDEDFTQLLYIAQKYMNKVFTPRECEVFAYLYDGLKMSADLLEYLVEYCVQGGHYSIRYLETVALNWHEKDVRTVEAARFHTASFSNEAFAVMRAFGLSDRRPGDSEMAMIRKWYQEWGFAKELVLEACGRTLRATQKPSFAYADRILGEWRKAGVRRLEDVRKLDGARESKKPQAAAGAAGPRNKFHNFEQRDTNYDAIVLEQLKKRLGEQ